MTERMVAVGARGNWEKALEFSRSLGSVVKNGGLASDAVYKTRLESCHGCDKIDRAPDGQEYCGECDCGRWPLSRLDNKLRFPELICPLGRKGFSNEGVPLKVEAWQPCVGCGKPEPDRSTIDVGARVLIVAVLPGEVVDRRAWRVESAAGDIYELVRPRRWFTWAWWRARGRPERVSVSRLALGRA